LSTFPVTKTPTLASWVRVLRAIGTPVNAGLRRARLPTLFEELPDVWLPYERVRCFVADMAAREGIPDLGFVPDASDTRYALSGSVTGQVMSAPTLHQALKRIPGLTGRQTTDIRFWLEPAGDQVRICVVFPLPPPLDLPGYELGETRTLALITNIIRAFVGRDFAPTRLLLASRARDLHFNLESRCGDVPVNTDQAYGALEFPRALLSSTLKSAVSHLGNSSVSIPDAVPPDALSGRLQACLEPYLLEGYAGVDLAAEIVGCGKRTLQRTLRAEGTSYSALVDKVRCHAALSQLRDSGSSLIEVAHRLGYSEHSAFTRAFRRWTGVSPREYREGTA
jgi:AraC-like DNA-binding protein